MKGHMEDGKFHPHTQSKGVRKSRDQKIKTQGVRLKRSDGSRIKKLEFKVWKFDDAPDDIKEKILEKLRQSRMEFSDDFFTQDQGLIFDDIEKKDYSDIGLNAPFPKFYDVGSNRGTDFVQFRDLQIENEDKFAKYLGINKKLQKKINFEFENDNNRDMDNTTLEITLPSDEVITTDNALDDFDGMLAKPRETFEDISKDEFISVLDAIFKFDKLMSMSLRHLVNNFEDQFTDETLSEDARANDWDFDEDGNIV